MARFVGAPRLDAAVNALAAWPSTRRLRRFGITVGHVDTTLKYQEYDISRYCFYK